MKHWADCGNIATYFTYNTLKMNSIGNDFHAENTAKSRVFTEYWTDIKSHVKLGRVIKIMIGIKQ